MIVALDQRLKAEAIAAPRASGNLYALADRICVICNNALSVHDQFAARSPRGENNQIDGVWAANWGRLAWTYRNTIQGLHVQYRDTVEGGPVFVKAVASTGIGHRDFVAAPVRGMAAKLASSPPPVKAAVLAAFAPPHALAHPHRSGGRSGASGIVPPAVQSFPAAFVKWAGAFRRTSVEAHRSGESVPRKSSMRSPHHA